MSDGRQGRLRDMETVGKKSVGQKARIDFFFHWRNSVMFCKFWRMSRRSGDGKTGFMRYARNLDFTKIYEGHTKFRFSLRMDLHPMIAFSCTSRFTWILAFKAAVDLGFPCTMVECGSSTINHS